MDIQKKRDFLINCAYWAVMLAAAYLAFEYVLPISVPLIFGVLIAWLVVWISNKLRCPHKTVRIGLAVLIYGILGLVITWLAAKGVSALMGIIQWLPEVYENKLLPFVTLLYQWVTQNVSMLDPALISALETLLEGMLSMLKNLVSYLSSGAMSVVTNVATGVPNLLLSTLAMIFSTVFVVGDYERIAEFANAHTPGKVKAFVQELRSYLTDTLFVVIRSYALIMLLTFTELSVLFSLFGIENGVLKAAAIAMLDILPILGTGGIMIPWGIISLMLGYTTLGIELLAIYAIVTVVRNYVEPKIVGTQLGLHPIITLVSMFIGLRLFGFWGLFGLPVGISFLWKRRNEKEKVA